MADGHTRRKLWHDGYSGSISLSDQASPYLKLKKYYLKSQPHIGHNCSHILRRKSDENNWLVFLLSFGLKQTLSNPNQSTNLKNGNKLLTPAKLNDNKVPFLFPKSVSLMNNGLIIVCDTGNNRLIGFNSGGVQTFLLDAYNVKNETFPFSSPLSTCAVNNLYFAVANFGNSVINLITPSGVNEHILMCQSKPICITSDFSNTLFVLTKSQTIECFSICGKTLTTIEINIKGFFTLMTANTSKDEIYLGESHSDEIYVISKKGSPLRRMKLFISGSGLHIFINNLHFRNNKIVVTDPVNRCIFLFDCYNGKFLEILLNSKTGLGCVQAAASTRDNKLIVTEFSLNEPHNVKIFTCNFQCNSADINKS